MTTWMDELAGTVASIADTVTPGVVRLGGWRGANGVVIGVGQVLTNAHNVHRGPVTARFADGRTAEATVAGIDGDGDIAVLTVDTGDAPVLPWADGAPPAIGTPVFAVTGTDSGPRVTFGLVSGIARSFRGPRGRRIAGSIEHTAPMARGSSGSGLVDATGRLLALNTNRLEGGLYLALPTDAALRARCAALGQGETPIAPRLGVGIAPSWAARRMRHAVGLPELDGLLVRDVDPDGNAARAGIATGDLIVAADGKPVPDADELADALAAANGTVELTIVRGVEERVVPVVLI
jgi:S1-C subfamily serine protease